MADQQKPAGDSAAAPIKRKKAAQPYDREAEDRRSGEQMAVVSQLFPDQPAALLAVAEHALRDGHAAVISGSKSAALVAWNRYRAVIWKMNGRTFFGCNDRSRPGAGGIQVEQHCRAEPGTVPMWGQTGEFVIEHAGVRALVKFGGWHSFDDGHFEFHALDLDGPFISETGYRSHFVRAHEGLTVDQVAEVEFAYFLDTSRRYLEPSYQDRRSDDKLPDWLVALPCPPRRPKAIQEDAPPEAQAIPPGFTLVDAVLTAHQAFQVRKWAEAAEGNLGAARAKMHNN